MKKTELEIHVYGDRCLRKKSSRVKKVAEKERALLEAMAQTMHTHNGIGLAAPQIGINKSMIVIDIGEGIVKLVNPRVKKKKGRATMTEGCLSLPGVAVEIRRAKQVFVEGKNERDETVGFWADNLLSRALQHEIDHLKGKLILDYADFLSKIRFRKMLRTFRSKKAKG